MKDIESAKTVVDGLSIGVVASTIIGWLPAIASAVTIIWMLIRIGESKSAKWLFRKWRK